MEENKRRSQRKRSERQRPRAAARLQKAQAQDGVRLEAGWISANTAWLSLAAASARRDMEARRDGP